MVTIAEEAEPHCLMDAVTELLDGLPPPVPEPEQVDPRCSPVDSDDPLEWPCSPMPFRPAPYPDARAQHCGRLVIMQERPHQDDEPVVAGYWRLLAGLETSPGIRVAQRLYDGPVQRMLLEAGVMAELSDERMADVLDTEEAVVSNARLLFFDAAMPFRAAQLDLMQRFWSGDPAAVLPAVAQHGGWVLVEMALGMRDWTVAGRQQMDELLGICTERLLFRLWDRACRINNETGNQQRTLDAYLRLQRTMNRQRTGSAPDGCSQHTIASQQTRSAPDATASNEAPQRPYS